MLKKPKKTKVIDEFKVHDTDTGSAEVQVALLSEQIKQLTSHLKKHNKDTHSRYGLLKMVSKRKRFLDYLKNEDDKRYQILIKKLAIKR
jgi:small subunit ribosomal protein S15